MQEDEAAAVAHELFRISGKLERLATEKDDTFRLTEADGARYILKVSNPVEAQSEIDLQTSLLKFIAVRDPALPIPRVLGCREGAYGRIIDRAGQSRLVRAMTYLPGTPLDACEANAAQRREVGEILGRLRLAMAGFQHPGAERSLAWDVKNLPRLAHLLDGVEDGQQRQLLQCGLERFARVLPGLASLPVQVLHNDFSKSNIVVRSPGQAPHASSAPFVAGIIDFGDTVRTAVAIDVSTALLNQLPRNEGQLAHEDLFGEARDVLHGYLTIAPLSDAELAMIPHLVMARVITRALLSLNLARRFPDNRAYLLRNTLQGWAQLDWFLRRSEDEVGQTLLALQAAHP